jgi:hypothetical protein
MNLNRTADCPGLVFNDLAGTVPPVEAAEAIERSFPTATEYGAASK